MRTKEILGKEVLNLNVTILGKVVDFEIDPETYQITGLVINKGNIKEKMNIKKSEDIIPVGMVSKVGDKILLKDLSEEE
ncbi:PRC-barrel domain-containing protein [Methanobrevibacter sp. UBA412]|jgi:sporulation protein YlmC with PRC-barrel domain|uniref:PRC-barrel domain-containing protein n=1 Tax=Methanobrevibacter sp. UBA412 TaxID=1915486 RepID=UPI0039B854F2